MNRQKCENCGQYLLALQGEVEPFYVHPETPCSGISDAIFISYELEDEELQKIFEEKYGHPQYSDHELLNRIWTSPILRYLIKLYFKLKKR